MENDERFKNCRQCDGRGTMPDREWDSAAHKFKIVWEFCKDCAGTGQVER